MCDKEELMNDSSPDDEEDEDDEEDSDLLSEDESDDGEKQPTSLFPGSENDGTDRILWTQFVPTIRDTSSDEFIAPSGEPTSYAKKTVRQGQVLSAFRLFFDQLMVDKICAYSTAEARRSKLAKAASWKLTPGDLDRFLAFIIARTAFDAKQMSVHLMRSAEWGPEFFQKCITRRRLQWTMRFLRFDDKGTRAQRLKLDRLAMISEIWHRFSRNCRINYTPGTDLNLDFQLVQSRVRSKFTQQIQEQGKPNKHGLLFMLLVDPETNYIVHSVPYLHETLPPRAHQITERLAINLLKPYIGVNKTIITGEWVTSVALANALLEKNTKLVGPTRVRKTGEDAYKNLENLDRYHSAVYRSPDHLTLTTYQEKNEKPSVILSSRHSTVQLDDTPARTPDTFKLYKQSGQAVRTVEYATQQLSTRVKSNRWTMYVFYNLLDLILLNSWILYQAVTGSKLARREFLLQLAEELCQQLGTPDDADHDPLGLFDDQQEQQHEEKHQQQELETKNGKSKRARCGVRKDPRCKQNKTTTVCRFCGKLCCVACSSTIRNVCKGCFTANRALLMV